MQCLYPDIRTNQTYQLQVDDSHTLYIEESGDPQGIPILFLHGGPGAGTSSFDRRFFDPDKYRIILFDQRGAGQSKPHASLNDNSTSHLIADIEKIREYIKVEKQFIGRKPNTRYSTTDLGRAEFKKHISALEKLINKK